MLLEEDGNVTNCDKVQEFFDYHCAAGTWPEVLDLTTFNEEKYFDATHKGT